MRKAFLMAVALVLGLAVTASAEVTKAATRQADYDAWMRDFLGGGKGK